MDPAKKMRTGSLMRKDYSMQKKASEAEIQAAKSKAMAGGMPEEVANNIFTKYKE